MSFTYIRQYSGPIRGVVLDWAGTAVDHGCIAPVGVFVEVFKTRGVDVTLAEAREPMGMHKRAHIATMCAMPALRKRWVDARGSEPTDEEIDAMYTEMEPLALEALPKHADLVPGLLDTVRYLRERRIRLGSTTGYNRVMLDRLVELVAPKGYRPDSHVAASEVPGGRPAPYMAWEALSRCGVDTIQACVKAGDTVVDVQAGLNAGMWSVGLAATGNEVGLDAAQLAALSLEDREARVSHARDKLARAGAHMVIDSIAQLPSAIETIEAWIRAGRRP